MTAESLRAALYRSYRRFWSVPHVLGWAPTWYRWMGRELGTLTVAAALFHRLAGSLRFHPMSGGVGRLRLDGARDFAHLRRRYFGCDQVPLPRSAALSPKDEALNHAARAS